MKQRFQWICFIWEIILRWWSEKEKSKGWIWGLFYQLPQRQVDSSCGALWSHGKPKAQRAVKLHPESCGPLVWYLLLGYTDLVAGTVSCKLGRATPWSFRESSIWRFWWQQLEVGGCSEMLRSKNRSWQTLLLILNTSINNLLTCGLEASLSKGSLN